MKGNHFKLKVKIDNHPQDSQTLAYLSDLFAKIEGCDRSLLENGTCNIGVCHHLEPSYKNSMWDFTIQVVLTQNGFPFIDEAQKSYLLDYLAQSRKTIMVDLLSSNDKPMLDSSLEKLNSEATSLSDKSGEIFVPNTAKILRNIADLVTLDNTFDNSNLNFIADADDPSSDHPIIISKKLKHLLQGGDVDLTEKPYDKALMLVKPNMYNREGKWEFRNGGETVSYYVRDYEWINNYFDHGVPNLIPTFFMSVTIGHGPVGRGGKVEPYINKVHKTESKSVSQMGLFTL